jgi:methyl-accepting chemotaxis protein
VVLAVCTWSLHGAMQAPAPDVDAAWERLVSVLLLAAALVGAALYRLHRSVTQQLGGAPDALHEQLALLGRGDLASVGGQRPALPTSTLATLEAVRKALLAKISRIRHEADTVAHESVTFSSNNLDLSANMAQQTDLLRQSTASIDSLLDTVKQATSKTTDAQKSVVYASEIAVKGNQVVSQMTSTMDTLSESSGKIGEIIGVIDGIAFQTCPRGRTGQGLCRRRLGGAHAGPALCECGQGDQNPYHRLGGEDCTVGQAGRPGGQLHG